MATLVLVAPTALSAQGGQDPAPRGVSPGSPAAAEKLAGSCPTFSWSHVDAALGYELVLYRVGETGALETALQTQIAAGASSWTPSASQCPASEAEYAWAVRALTEDGAGAWSEPLLFATAGAPTDDEIRLALATLRRHRAGGGPTSHNPEPTTGRAGAAPTTQNPQPTTDQAGADIEALSLPTLAATPSPQTVTLPASFSLSLGGDVELGGFVFKDGASFIHNDGTNNTALGTYALNSLTTGFRNTAIGDRALFFNTTGSNNSAIGNLALYANTEGDSNIANGVRALYFNTTGSNNTASGFGALFSNTTGYGTTAIGERALFSNTTGVHNTASGARALYFNTTGFNNTAIGVKAGYFWTTGDNNIALGRGAGGLIGESDVIRIGGANFQTKTYIEGISNASGVFDDFDVCIEGDQLGPCNSSSARFKQDVQPLGDVLSGLSALRPVSFLYREEFDQQATLRYGLIAEEVAEVFPSLVGRDAEGRPSTVRYDLLTPLLLGEIQSLHRQMAERDRDYRQTIADLKRRLDKLAKKKRFR